MGIWIALGIIFFLVGFFIVIYNNLVALYNRANNAFAQIDVQLKRRYDLIPNLIEVAKKYLSHEEQTLLKVIEARNTAKSTLDSINKGELDSEKIAELGKAESLLDGALKGLNITLEAYPDLKANQNMMQLNEELSSTENKIAFARQAYNDSATEFNIFKQSFPQNLIAGLFAKFQKDLEMLSFEESKEILNQAPKVQF